MAQIYGPGSKGFLVAFIATLLLLPIVVAAMNFYRRHVPINNGVASNVCEFLQFKHEVASAFSAPRLFLFGLSNVLMGMRAEELSRILNRPVVNFGLIANMHNGMAYEAIEREVKSGDTVLLALPYWYFDEDTRIEGQEKIVRDLAFSCPIDGFSRLPFRYKLKFLLIQDPTQVVEGVARRMFGGWKMKPIAKSGLFTVVEKGGTYNKYGDYETISATQRTAQMTAQIAENPQPLERYRVNVGGDGVRQLRRFVRDADALGVQVIATWPVAYARSTDGQPAIYEQITRVYESLGVKILGSPSDFLYPIHFFSNSNNHLTREGSTIHSEQLSNLLTAVRTLNDRTAINA